MPTFALQRGPSKARCLHDGQPLQRDKSTNRARRATNAITISDDCA
jgi:hypothetical protein